MKVLTLGRLCAGLLALSLLLGCEDKIAALQREVTQDDLLIERISEVDILYSDSAVVRLRIQAPTLLNHLTTNEERKEFPDGLRASFFDAYGQVTSTLTARRATQYERRSMIVIQDSVVVQSADGDRLETDELIWDERQQTLYTQKLVKVTTAEEQIYGYGFRSNQDFTEWQVNKVTGRFLVDAPALD